MQWQWQYQQFMKSGQQS